MALESSIPLQERSRLRLDLSGSGMDSSTAIILYRDIEITIKLPMTEDKKYRFSNILKVSQIVQNLREEGMLSKPLKDYYVMRGNTELDLDLQLHVYNLKNKKGGY